MEFAHIADVTHVLPERRENPQCEEDGLITETNFGTAWSAHLGVSLQCTIGSLKMSFQVSGSPRSVLSEVKIASSPNPSLSLILDPIAMPL